TTKIFAEYFGIASTKPEEIRSFLEKKLGVTPSQMAVPPVATLESPAPPAALPTPPPGATNEPTASPT
ncbi:MAG: hypothetical protein L3J91_02520, partial [Thermoplasmata archaeon]|nr:hypothetical protein [Thermoplasmata archaeon]